MSYYYRPGPADIFKRATLMETVNGIEIRYDSITEKFIALVGDRYIQRAGIQAMRKIASTVNLENPIQGFKVNEQWPERFYNSPLLTIVAVEGVRMRTKGGTLLHFGERVYHYDQAVIDELTRIYEAKMEADKVANDLWKVEIAKLKLITLEEVSDRETVSAVAPEHSDLG